MASKYERAISKLEKAAVGPMSLVIVDDDPAESARIREQFMQRTGGRGSFAAIRADAADL